MHSASALACERIEWLRKIKTEYIVTKVTKFHPEQVDVLPSKNQALCT